MKHLALSLSVASILVAVLFLSDQHRSRAGEANSLQPGWTLLAWNDLGMHCMDSDYSVYSILPPFNTIRAQLIDDDGDLVTTAGGFTLTYEAVADPSGSINKSSAGKTNFWQFANALYGSTATTNQGIAGHDMPGGLNLPQPMVFSAAEELWHADGIPITPIDDFGNKRYYPMMRVTARNGAGLVLASTDVVLPVSDEMDCRLCHASDSPPNARPAAGWVNDRNSERDYRLNVLQLHDERQLGKASYTGALAAQGYSALGLVATVNAGTPILCAGCHRSNALPGTGVAGIAPLTTVMHAKHTYVYDYEIGTTLGASDNRSACYRCHPGSETRCLRGAMGNAVAADGSLAIQCQNCHGDMADVGSVLREGWLDQPNCQACHTGTALANNGQIRYDSALDANGQLRVPVDQTFATNPDTPALGISLYRFSTGHGGLQCEACHGSTHAEYPGLHGNDNLQAIDIQGHAGTITECTACHDEMPETVTGGPHGLHPIGQSWIDDHEDAAENGGHFACRSCHGTDYKGTVLSAVAADRSFNTDFGLKVFQRGMQVGCYDCHDGPTDDDQNNDPRPVAQSASASSAGAPVTVTLAATDAGNTNLNYRLVGQPAFGTVALAGNQATYFPIPGFAGDEDFRFVARDLEKDSLPATVTITRGAESSHFGYGWAGTNGAPTLDVDQPPVLGQLINLQLGNSWGMPAGVAILHSAERLIQPTYLGGTLYLRPDNLDWAGLTATGTTIPVQIPFDPTLIGLSFHIQTAQFDPGAPFLWSFSKGLTLTLGQ